MAWQGEQVLIPGLRAGADLSAAANKFKFVKLSAINTVVLCDGATDRPIGVLQNRPASGEGADVCAVGITKVQGDADLAVGNLIGTSGDGQADAKTPGTDTTEYVVGVVLEDNTTAGGLCVALINCASPARAA